MYVAEYKSKDAALKQIALTFKVVVEPGENEEWNTLLNRAIDLISGESRVHWAIRISVDRGRLNRTLLIQYQDLSNEEISLLVAPFLRLNIFHDKSVAIPMNREEHDAILADFSQLKYWHQPEIYECEGFQFIDHFWIRDYLNDLMSAAIRTGGRFDYQANIRPFTIPKEIPRLVRKNLVRMEEESNLPEAVRDEQCEFVKKALSGDALVEEIIGVDSNEGAANICKLLSKVHESQMSDSRFSAQKIGFNNHEHVDELIQIGLHSSVALQVSPFMKAAMLTEIHKMLNLIHTEVTFPKIAGLFNNCLVRGDISNYSHFDDIERKLTTIENKIRTEKGKSLCQEMKNAISIAKADMPFSMAKSRYILELIIHDIYKKQTKSQKTKTLFAMIEHLSNIKDFFPKTIHVYLNTIRIMGNSIIHAQSENISVSMHDIKIILLMTLNILEWYLIEYLSQRELS